MAISTTVLALSLQTAGSASGEENPPVVDTQHWSCGRAAPPNLDSTGGHHTNTTANMRVGSSTRCAISGSATPSESLDYYCYALDINGSGTWTYVVSVQTRQRGWIRDDLLDDGGSVEWCPGQT
jgi:hypothetical protein